MINESCQFVLSSSHSPRREDMHMLPAGQEVSASHLAWATTALPLICTPGPPLPSDFDITSHQLVRSSLELAPCVPEPELAVLLPPTPEWLRWQASCTLQWKAKVPSSPCPQGSLPAGDNSSMQVRADCLSLIQCLNTSSCHSCVITRIQH